MDGGVALPGVEVVDQARRLVEERALVALAPRARGVPTDDALLGVHAAQEAEHGLVEGLAHGDLAAGLRVRHGVGVRHLDDPRVLVDVAQQSPDDPLLRLLSSNVVVQHAEHDDGVHDDARLEIGRAHV